MLVSQHSKRGEVNPVLLSLDCSILLKVDYCFTACYRIFPLLIATSNTPGSCSSQVQYCHYRRHSEMGNEVVVNAGTVAQRRRPHRCLSASHVPLEFSRTKQFC
ncbi:hypothetical protein GBAR_LOCUS27604 [Geodia barretti]|uniref:Uncharacterized protein n=1 Tax=Geodia barretti TaxID=519541 RepID=A0AA35TNM4_GEOBA|nr:hypothetical protein GBAR_LOCUS27604 [Geodia barretti]